MWKQNKGIIILALIVPPGGRGGAFCPRVVYSRQTALGVLYGDGKSDPPTFRANSAHKKLPYMAGARALAGRARGGRRVGCERAGRGLGEDTRTIDAFEALGLRSLLD